MQIKVLFPARPHTSVCEHVRAGG